VVIVLVLQLGDGRLGLSSGFILRLMTGGLMGKGDRKTRRGKLWRGSFGKRRPRKRKRPAVPKT
jgi:30S ribosomal protein S31